MALFRSAVELLRGVRGHPIQGAVSPKVGAAQQIAVSGTTARSAALGSKLVRVTCDVDCFIEFGDATVEATTTDTLIRGGTVEYFTVGSTASVAHVRLAAILASGSGTLHVSPCA